MPVLIDVDKEFNIGEAWFASVSPRGDWATVFEDDGETAYFYASEWVQGKFGKVLDALHIYNVENVTDRDKPSRAKLGWTQDGCAAILLINGYPHAVFDMSGGRATCRTGFPPPSGTSPFKRSDQWDESLVTLFR